MLAAHVGAQGPVDSPVLKFSIAPEASLVDFQYYFDKKCKISKKAPCLTVKLTIKNVSNEPFRYITAITLPDEGKSVGGYVPRKGAKDKKTKKRGPAVIQPGKTKTVKYPMFQFEQPKCIEIEVQAMK
jgi:hypothetical protein